MVFVVYSQAADYDIIASFKQAGMKAFVLPMEEMV